MFFLMQLEEIMENFEITTLKASKTACQIRTGLFPLGYKRSYLFIENFLSRLNNCPEVNSLL